MCFVGDNERPQVSSALVRFSRIDDFLFDKTENKQHLRVRHRIVLIRKKRLKIEVDKVCIDFERGRRVPNVRISAVYKFLQVQFRRAHIAQGQIVHFLLVLLLQYCKQVGKQRKVLCFEVRTIGRFGDAFSLIRFHNEIIDEFDNVRARAHKHDFEETFKHFQVRIERNRRLGGRSVLRQYLIDMERIDSAFFRVADVYQITRQIFCQGQVLGFGIENDYPRIVCPLVCDERL